MQQITVESSKATQELRDLAHSANEVLFRCKAVFPFDFFPDSVVVTQNKVDIIYSEFFFVKSVHTVLVENILTVQASVGPLFASLIFEVKGYQQSPPEVRFLNRTDAVAAQEIIMGLVSAKQQGINLNQLKSTVVAKRANQIGSTHEDVTGM